MIKFVYKNRTLYGLLEAKSSISFLLIVSKLCGNTSSSYSALHGMVVYQLEFFFKKHTETKRSQMFPNVVIKPFID